MNTKNTLILIGAIIIVVAGAYYFLQGGGILNKSDQVNPEETDQLIGGDQDEHGCLLAAGYSWCAAKQKCLRPWEEACADYVDNFFQDMASATGIVFSEPSDTDLAWQVESEEGVEELTLAGSMIGADNVADEQFQLIKDFFIQEMFKLDGFNARGGIMGEFGAYRQDGLSLVCTLTGMFSDLNPDDSEYEPQTTDKNVEIICASLDKSLVPEISTVKRIREVLAAKHNTKVAEVAVNITQETADFARGGVMFQPDASEEHGGGNFLAAKVNGVWEIVFDGNGSVACADLADYNFPAEMIEDICY